MSSGVDNAGRLVPRLDSLSVTGDWTLVHYATLQDQVEAARARIGNAEVSSLDLSEVVTLDTAGAALLVELLGAENMTELTKDAPDLPPARRALLHTVAQAMAKPLTPQYQATSPLIDFLARTGEGLERFWRQQRLLLGFIGLILSSLIATLWRPGRWRITALVAQIQQTGLYAIGIVALLTFLVGAVVAFLGATVLQNFGATIYTVDLIAFSFLREFGVLLAAILLAGRTASAFTAQIGSMKANEEIDALRALGLNTVELLVLPRVLALLMTLPILTFIGMLSGIIGGALVCLLVLDISALQFVIILQGVPLKHFLVGLAKAPIFAFFIAAIGCLEGFKVSGSAQSVGEHTTSSVVQSIFMVILLDAIAALFFMEMGW
ncbi:phospholipid/cholesterol/gamma-HCH transport system permease protein [Modicisalibacter ilicicola DSM 19980]|uniref:Phospholipid/cholesterol/gamma-HCH transport system permease protein n=1 Tax=Modicisalibacter ilicicola DSM 19980 TaxID=1121942 RepID=A0A1M5AVF3_9GAMM|nr:ABC transporter permease [Halomonas ilicicola]SHF34231.1 phospholipid/cholesterol/gamma-HCH transport system permease protein [Halomonas ilicicola DSM 19980]